MHLTKYSAIILFVLLFTPFASAEFAENTVNSSDGVPISYRVQGEGEPALMFVHGWLTNQSFWDAQRELFAQTHKVITLDLAGHGNSGQERQEWTIEAFGDDVAAVLRALNLEKVILVGHAVGGSVALEAARQFPEQVIGIVGVDTFQNFELTSTLEQQERILAKLRKNYQDLITRSVRAMFSPGADPALVEKTVTEMSSIPEEIGIAAMQASMSYKLIPAIQSLSIPIRSINSDAFPTNISGNKQHVESYEIVLVPESKHLFFLESADEFNGILANVLQEVAAYSTKEADTTAAE